MIPGGGSELVGRVFAGRYEVRRPLGQGGMGAVFEGRETTTGGTVAIKVLFDVAARSFERFRQEAVAMAKLDHPNIVRIHGFHADPGTPPFIVMERVDGVSLRSRLIERRQLPSAQAIPIAMAMLDALAFAHRAGIIHRDIKPANVMLARSANGGETVKVVDFGIAKLLEGGIRTTTGSVFGTPGYLAPEQVSGAVIDARADIWAAGIVLFEMLTGTRPWRSRIAAEVIAESLLQPALPLRSFLPDAPPALEAILQHALQRVPNERFPSAEAMRAALATVDATPRASTSPAPRHPTLTGAASPDRERSTRSARAPRRIGVFLAAAASSIVLGGVGLGALLLRGASSPAAPSSASPPPSISSSERDGSSSEERAPASDGGDAIVAAFDDGGSTPSEPLDRSPSLPSRRAPRAVTAICAKLEGDRLSLLCSRSHADRCMCNADSGSVCPVPYVRKNFLAECPDGGLHSFPWNAAMTCKGFTVDTSNDTLVNRRVTGSLDCDICNLSDARADAVTAVPGAPCRGIDWKGKWIAGAYIPRD